MYFLSCLAQHVPSFTGRIFFVGSQSSSFILCLWRQRVICCSTSFSRAVRCLLLARVEQRTSYTVASRLNPRSMIPLSPNLFISVPISSHLSYQNDVAIPFPMAFIWNVFAISRSFKKFLHIQKPCCDFSPISQKCFFFVRYMRIHLPHKEFPDRKRHINFSPFTVLTSFSERNPKPPSLVGKHSSDQATLTPEFFSSGPVHKNAEQSCSISLIHLLGRR